MSPVPSPPLPGSPSYQQQATAAEVQSTNLHQQLQRLHLQQHSYSQCATASPPPSYPHPRGSPPTYTPLLQHSKPEPIPNVASVDFPMTTNVGMAQLLNYTSQTHQRSSPPPNYQNLHMIEEDINDSTESTSKEILDSSASSSPTQFTISPTLDFTQDLVRKKPQISITDTHGHVIPVSTNSDDMLTDECTTTSHVNTKSSVQFVDTSAPVMSSSSPRHQRYITPVIGQIPALNLANIPPEINVNGMDTDMPPTIHHSRTYPFMDMYSLQLNALGLNNPIDQINNLWHLRHNVNDAYSVFESDKLNMKDSHSPSHDPYPKLAANENQFDLKIKSKHENSLHDAPSKDSLEALNTINLVNGFGDVSQCFMMSINVSSNTSQQDIMDKIKDALDHKHPGVNYRFSNNLFQLEHSDVQLEMEVCRGVAENGLRFRKIAGDPCQYHKLCNELVAGLNL